MSETFRFLFFTIRGVVNSSRSSSFKSQSILSNNLVGEILRQIQSFNITNVLVAVVRYFGGIKLGVGGLTSAYKTAAHTSLANALIVEDIEREIIVIEIEYDQLPELMNFVKQNNVRILDKKIDKICQIRISVPVEYIAEVEKFVSKLQNLEII